MEQLRGPLFEDKVVDFILELAKVNDKPVTAAELMADPDAEDSDANGAEAAAEASPKKGAGKKAPAKKASAKKAAASKSKE
jgi:trigger factor